LILLLLLYDGCYDGVCCNFLQCYAAPESFGWLFCNANNQNEVCFQAQNNMRRGEL
jgi:hypothetical protein